VGGFITPTASTPDWFDGTQPPDPVDWYLDPTLANNSCYFAPRGNGAQWQAFAMGCHNPRLDMDTVSCDVSVTDPTNSAFCNPENANIDFPPLETWTRIGVQYYSNQLQTYAVHPVIKVFCDGRLAAHLGPEGYDAPVTFASSEGAVTTANTFWLAADVAFVEDACGQRGCVVAPLYSNASSRTAVRSTAALAAATFGPAYPPPRW
jgi:hypothetical protein